MRRKVVRNSSKRVMRNPTDRAYENAVYDEARRAGYHITHVEVNQVGKYAIATDASGYHFKVKLRPKSVAPFRSWTATTKRNPNCGNWGVKRNATGKYNIGDTVYTDVETGNVQAYEIIAKDRFGTIYSYGLVNKRTGTLTRADESSISKNKRFFTGYKRQNPLRIPKRNPLKKSKGHLLFSGDFEYFVKDGDIWKANLTSSIEHTGINKGYRASRFWATDTPFHRSYAKNRERAMREDHITKSNPHGFCIVDQHLNKIASGNDYDKLQDRVDRHNEEHDEKWFVIDESDYMELNKKGRRNPKRRLVTNGGSSVNAWGEGTRNPLPLTQYPVSRSNRITENDFTRINNDVNGNPRYVIHFLRIAPSYERALKIARKVGGRKFHNKQYGGGIAFQSYSLNELINHLEPLTERRNPDTGEVSNVSMGYYDSSGFHPIRASHDYDEDAVDEHYRKRPVRKYARKEKAFKSKRRNAHGKYLVIAYKNYYGDLTLGMEYEHSRTVMTRKRGKILFEGSFHAANEFYDRELATGKYSNSKYAKRHNTATASNPETFNIDKLDKLSGIFQGHINGKQIKTVGSDWTPPLTSRLGKLAYIKLKNGKEIYEINFNANGDAWLSADARKNLYLEGKDAIIKNAAKPKRGGLIWLGEVEQINYRTNKSHIENGQLVEYYHELGEVDGVKPNAFLDHDGFILLNGGNYDIDVHGIEN